MNDLLLAAVTGGLRALLSARGEDMAALTIRTSVPAATAAGHQASGIMLVDLPVREADPVAASGRDPCHDGGGEAAARPGAGAITAVVHLPLPLARAGMRWMRRFGGTRVNLFVSDVPGPPAPLWLAGARMLEAVPVGPLVQHVGLGIVALSYAGELAVSVHADGSVADLEVLAEGWRPTSPPSVPPRRRRGRRRAARRDRSRAPVRDWQPSSGSVLGSWRRPNPASSTLRRPTVGRFPRWVYGAGDEPDARFSLANERTFLAWIRTSLALSAAGVALEAVDLPVAPSLRDASALLLVALGVSPQCWPGCGGRRSSGGSGSPARSRHRSSVRCWPWASPWRRCCSSSDCSSGEPGARPRRRPRHAGRADRPRVATHGPRGGGRGRGRAPGGGTGARSGRCGGGRGRRSPRRARILAGRTPLPRGAGVAAGPGRPGGGGPARPCRSSRCPPPRPSSGRSPSPSF